MLYIHNRKWAKEKAGVWPPLVPPTHPLFNLERKEQVSCGSARILSTDIKLR